MKPITFLKKFIFIVAVFNLLAFGPLSYAETKQTAIKQEQTMKFNNFSYIFLGPGLDPTKDRQQIVTKDFTFTAVGIDFQHKEQVIAVAKEMIAQGAQMIELCGGFGPIWVAKVSEAINNQVPVGTVVYGPEARKPLLDLLSTDKKS